MIEERAVVLSASAGTARVQAIRRSTCGACSAKGACGTSLLDRVLGRRPLELELADNIGVSAGDEVIVGVPEEALVISAFVAYMVPLFGMIGAALIGTMLAERLAPDAVEGWSMALGIGGLALTLIWVRGRSRRLGSDPRWRARLLRRASAVSPSPVTVELR
jgi:sigma-E factor negative regulatory protein RseC